MSGAGVCRQNIRSDFSHPISQRLCFGMTGLWDLSLAQLCLMRYGSFELASWHTKVPGNADDKPVYRS